MPSDQWNDAKRSRLLGRVFGEDETPSAGERISVIVEAVSDGESVPAELLTDKDGIFTVPVEVGARVRLAVMDRHSGREVVTVGSLSVGPRSAQGVLEVVLRSPPQHERYGGVIASVVDATGSAVAGALVGIGGVGGWTHGWGRVAFAGIPVGTADIYASTSDEEMTGSGTVEIHEGKLSEFTVEVGPRAALGPGIVRVLCVDEFGKPVPGALVGVVMDGELGEVGRSRAKSDGIAVVRGLPLEVGRQEVTVVAVSGGLGAGVIRARPQVVDGTAGRPVGEPIVVLLRRHGQGAPE